MEGDGTVCNDCDDGAAAEIVILNPVKRLSGERSGNSTLNTSIMGISDASCDGY
jgi:hypothetical protein